VMLGNHRSASVIPDVMKQEEGLKLHVVELTSCVANLLGVSRHVICELSGL